MVVPARMVQRRPVPPPGRRLGIFAVVHPLPGGLDERILRAHRVVVEVPALRGEVAEDLGEQAPLPVVGQVMDAHGGHHRLQLRGDRRGPLAAGRHVELDVAVASGEPLHLPLADPHHLGRVVGEDRGAARVQVQDHPRGRPGARAQVQERELVLVGKGKQPGQEVPVGLTAALLALGFRRPGLDCLGGLPDSRVGIRWLAHELRLPSANALGQEGLRGGITGQDEAVRVFRPPYDLTA